MKPYFVEAAVIAKRHTGRYYTPACDIRTARCGVKKAMCTCSCKSKRHGGRPRKGNQHPLLRGKTRLARTYLRKQTYSLYCEYR